MAAKLQVIETGMATANADRQKALDAALAQIDRAFGKGSAMKLGQKETMQVETISTGSLGLDIALGVGGLPRGRVIEIYGPESSGKTTLTLQVISEMQKLGGTCAFVDAEHALDVQYAQNLGVNLQDLLISQPDTGEQALEIAETLVRSNAVDLVVIDSVAALTPRAALITRDSAHMVAGGRRDVGGDAEQHEKAYDIVYVTEGDTNASLSKGDRLEAMLPERAFELLAIRREAIIEKGGVAGRKAAATKRAASKSTTTAKKAAAKKAPAAKKAAPAKKAAAKKAAPRWTFSQTEA